MIKRLIITCLVITILGYGMVVAADAHYGESSVDHVMMLADTTDDPHDLSTYDHCSHGSFHLIGLNFSTVKLPALSSLALKSAYLASWDSFLTPPPARPPKA
jgi:hypothetical protein